METKYVPAKIVETTFNLGTLDVEQKTKINQNLMMSTIKFLLQLGSAPGSPIPTSSPFRYTVPVHICAYRSIGNFNRSIV